MRTSAQLRQQIESALAGRIPAALSPRPLCSPELLSCGVPEVDALLGGGLPLGAIVELTGAASSGRTTLALSTLGELTRQGHCCAYVDSCDVLDPLSAVALGVELQRLLWVRPRESSSEPSTKSRAPHTCPPGADAGPACGTRAPSPRLRWEGRIDAALRATDLLLNAGGFRAVVLDLGEVPPEQARRTPMASWYRFRLQAEKSRTLLLLITPGFGKLTSVDPTSAKRGQIWGTLGSADAGNSTCSQNCAALSLHCAPASPEWRQAEAQSPALLAAMQYHVSVRRSRGADASGKKPPAGAGAYCEAAWRGAPAWTG